MSLSTSYRYEAMTEKKSLKMALHRPSERVRIDEMMACREQQAKLESQINLKSEWNEALQTAALMKKMKIDAKQTQEELKMARRAAIMVRQAALRRLLAAENQNYERELHEKGSAFYIQRA